MENDKPELIMKYMNATKSDKDLPFIYEADLKNPKGISNKTLYRLNNQLIRDNKDLNTDFDTVKNLRLKKFLSRIPGLNGLKALPGKVKQSVEEREEDIRETAKDMEGRKNRTLEEISKNLEEKYSNVDKNEKPEVKEQEDNDKKIVIPENRQNLSDKLKQEFPIEGRPITLESRVEKRIENAREDERV